MPPIAYEPVSDGNISLRPFQVEDVPALVRACKDPEIVRWTPVPADYDESRAKEWIASHTKAIAEGRSIPFAVTDAKDDQLLGAIELHLDLRESRGRVGYWLAASSRGRGIATRAVRLVAHFAFEVVGLSRLELLAHPDNVASQRVATRAGFAAQGMVQSNRLGFALLRDGSPDSRQP